MKTITQSMVEMTEEILKLKSENERLKLELSIAKKYEKAYLDEVRRK